MAIVRVRASISAVPIYEARVKRWASRPVRSPVSAAPSMAIAAQFLWLSHANLTARARGFCDLRLDINSCCAAPSEPMTQIHARSLDQAIHQVRGGDRRQQSRGIQQPRL